ncbi:C4-dicarboxylate transport sensor protein DctB [Octadecabacter antarcticus 307]|uniref:C4-dicarboxylate transport sensor protein DctB n=1 Tax=Octadecabacter antarcticus 307 TaxID=391626 RepID=M9R9F5_9RHOB|nr:ATP-binding protein [Octadecabacter antarcticus]AGI68842.1 C4-dicarboxylate transport sensor protein DctB [Octadecabacter antarcticus 307]
MSNALHTRIIAVVTFLVAVTALSAGVGWVGYMSALDQLAQRGRSDLALASDRLTGELHSYRELAVLMADHPTVAATVDGDWDREATGVADLLRQTADKTGSLDILVVSVGGRELASASGNGAEIHADQPYFTRAMDGALGVFHLVQERYDKRTFLFASPVFSDAGPVVGVVIVVVDVDAVESVWRGARPTVFFTDELGVTFISNRSEMVFMAREVESTTRSATAEYAPDLPRPFMTHSIVDRRGRAIWTVQGQRYVPRKALHLSLALPEIQMTGEALLDVAPAQLLAQLQAGVAAAICLAFGAMLFLATERRRTLADANAKLEGAVQTRTAELSHANAELRHEVRVRTEAEAQLKKAQSDLVQAGKLSALGQMSAGISHELNQPLMAIRSYAENAESYLERGNTGVAGENLSRIADLARRMGRIIRNLRSFAKQESEGLTDVDLRSVMVAVLEMTQARAKSSGVDIIWTAPETPLIVRGGEVRLQQVVLNLVTNAMDAMEGQSFVRRIEIDTEQVDGRVELFVRDTGPGLDEPDRIFDPFYTTKKVNQNVTEQDGVGQNGMGLGLSISYGLVQSFGGMIRGRNHPSSGAIFTVTLDGTHPREAAP